MYIIYYIAYIQFPKIDWIVGLEFKGLYSELWLQQLWYSKVYSYPLTYIVIIACMYYSHLTDLLDNLELGCHGELMAASACEAWCVEILPSEGKRVNV